MTVSQRFEHFARDSKIQPSKGYGLPSHFPVYRGNSNSTSNFLSISMQAIMSFLGCLTQSHREVRRLFFVDQEAHRVPLFSSGTSALSRTRSNSSSTNTTEYLGELVPSQTSSHYNFCTMIGSASISWRSQTICSFYLLS